LGVGSCYRQAQHVFEPGAHPSVPSRLREGMQKIIGLSLNYA
jgi:hypothetical protein